MTKSTQTATRYLLGELTEAEQTTFEDAYFGDARLFAEVAEAESTLVDDYVRHRLSPEVRARFEQRYLTDPRRRERVKFAATLATRLERAEPSSTAVTAAPPLVAPVEWRRWLEAVFVPTPALRWSLASLLILAVASGVVWLALDSSRSRQESAREEDPTAPVTPAAATGPATYVAPDAPPASATAPPVILALVLGPGVRVVDRGTPVTLVIPAGAADVRLVLTLQERDYTSYRVLLREVGGAEILRRSDLRPGADPLAAAFTVTVPASGFATGDYLLTLQGARGGGFDDLSQSLFRVDRK